MGPDQQYYCLLPGVASRSQRAKVPQPEHWHKHSHDVGLAANQQQPALLRSHGLLATPAKSPVSGADSGVLCWHDHRIGDGFQPVERLAVSRLQHVVAGHAKVLLAVVTCKASRAKVRHDRRRCCANLS